MFKRRFSPAMGKDLKLNYKIFKRREGSGPFQWESVGEDCRRHETVIGISN